MTAAATISSLQARIMLDAVRARIAKWGTPGWTVTDDVATYTNSKGGPNPADGTGTIIPLFDGTYACTAKSAGHRTSKSIRKSADGAMEFVTWKANLSA